MIKVLTVGQNTPSLKDIHSKLSPLRADFKEVCFTVAKPGAIGAAISDNVNILIYDAGSMNPLMAVLIQEIRKTGFIGPILILASVPQGMDITDFKKLKNVHILEKPYVKSQLLGVVKNCITDTEAKARRYQRFDVQESAVLETYNSDFKVETTINNISKNGVRIEGSLSGIKKGDLLRVHFNFDQIQKERVMSARVVWKKTDGDSKEEAGLEFVSQQAVYQYLLNSAIA